MRRRQFRECDVFTHGDNGNYSRIDEERRGNPAVIDDPSAVGLCTEGKKRVGFRNGKPTTRKPMDRQEELTPRYLYGPASSE